MGLFADRAVIPAVRIAVVAAMFAACATAAPAARAAGGVDWDPKQTWVFAVGILEWEHPEIWPAFPNAVKNRRDQLLVDHFRTAGVPAEQIVFLADKQATLKEVRSQFSELLDQTDEGDLLIVYFAGHGYRDGETKQTWFATYDAGKKNTSAWNVKSIFKQVDDHFSGDRVLMLADCCHSGALCDEVVRRGATEPATAALASVYAHNTSTGEWTFTDSVLKALRGRASVDTDGDRFIELNEMARYVEKEMAFVNGQKSVFTAAGGLAATMKLAGVERSGKPKADMHCEALSKGKWYKSRVLEYDSGADKYLVHYLGYDVKYDEWLEPANVRPYQPPQFAADTSVDALWKDGRWYPAVVRKAWYGLHFVRYDGYDSTFDEWLGPGRVRPRKKPTD
jgi:hypothetical protein